MLPFSWIEDFIEYLLQHQAHQASWLLLFIEESGIPIPVPGDVVIAYTGYQASIGRVGYVEAYFGLLVAVLAGASILYYLSRRFGKRLVLKLGRFIDLDEEKLDNVQVWFRKYGIWVIIFGRHIPGLRIPITIFSGMSHVPYRVFILGTFVSVIFWIAIYLYIGAKLGPKAASLVHDNQGFFLFVVVPVVLIAIFIWTFRKRK